MDSRWKTRDVPLGVVLPGILVGCAAVVMSIAVLMVALRTEGLVDSVLPERYLVLVSCADQSAGVSLLTREPIVLYLTPIPGQATDQRASVMQQEIAFRLHEIRGFLDQDPMNKGAFYNATARIQAHGVGLSEQFQDTELRTLLFELDQVVPEERRAHIQAMRALFEELAQLGPNAPFSEGEPADPRRVQQARDKFDGIGNEWQAFLDQKE